MSRLSCALMMLVLTLCGGRAFGADAPAPAPATATAQHVGVASCSGSTCHAAIKPVGKHPIRQDEYFIWQRKDAHAGTYNLLLEPRSNDMARRLGWGEAAQARGCLACHADGVAEPARGEKWLISDGVGCEVCHGGAGGWIDSHVQGYKARDEARADGLYPTWEPAARAQLCLSCHQGSRERPMTHAIMAAGHPPLLFELDTFSTLEPFHHELDKDYLERKGAQNAATAWIVGQAMSADELLGAIEAGRHRKGLMPELAFFDCDACHHPMKAGRGNAGRTAGADPGVIPLADSALVMIGVWARVIDPSLADRWQSGWSRLYRKGYASDEDLRREATALRSLLQSRILARAQSSSPDAAQLRRVIGGVLAAASGDHLGDYRFAEQVAMASLVLGSALSGQDGGGLDAEQKAAVDALYEAVRDRDRFNPVAWREALNRLQSRLAK